MRSNRRDLMTLGLSALTMGLVGSPGHSQAQQTWNGGHPVSDDPFWNDLSAATVTVDRASGAMLAAFPMQVQLRANMEATVEGFILPLEIQRQSNHFALTRRNGGCPFCAPNQPTEVVEILSFDPVQVSSELIRMTGRLRLNASSDAGMFYQLVGARRG